MIHITQENTLLHLLVITKNTTHDRQIEDKHRIGNGGRGWVYHPPSTLCVQQWKISKPDV